MPEHEVLTYRELADRLGISSDSARIKAKRRKWRVEPGNHPSDPVRVLVPIEFLSPVRTPSAHPGRAPRAQADATRALEDHIETLRRQVEEQRADLERERGQHREERTRLHEELAHERDRARAEREALLEQLQVLTERQVGAERQLREEVEALRAEIVKLSRPWWRKMLGR
jgi:hypothetical protein